MLREATARVELKGEEISLSVQEALDIFNKESKKGGVSPIKFLTYHPISRKFSYQTPSLFRPLNTISKVMALELEDCRVLMDITTRLLVKCNGKITFVPIGNLGMLTGVKFTVGFVDNQNEITFKNVKRVFDPYDPQKNPELLKPKEEPKKRGRKKAETKSVQLPVNAQTVVRAETKDGSYFVIDHLIVK